MTDARHLTWGHFGKLLTGGVPFRLPIQGDPPLQLLVDPGAGSLSLLVPWPSQDSLPVSPLAEIHVSLRTIDNQAYLVLGTSQPRLYRECFLLFLHVADEIQLQNRTPVQALNESLASWRELLREIAILSSEMQVGLWGELWTALRLMQTRGLTAIDGWIGPLRESHDFRLLGLDLEIKTTGQRERVHSIADLTQLVPSDGHRLFLLSLQVQLAGTGSGASLADAVAAVRAFLKDDALRLSHFDAYLGLLGYDEKYRAHYSTKYKLRSVPVLMEIDDSFPALTPQVITLALGTTRASRINRVQYEVYVDGLGFPDGDPEFVAVLPGSPEGGLV